VTRPDPASRPTPHRSHAVPVAADNSARRLPRSARMTRSRPCPGNRDEHGRGLPPQRGPLPTRPSGSCWTRRSTPPRSHSHAWLQRDASARRAVTDFSGTGQLPVETSGWLWCRAGRGLGADRCGCGAGAVRPACPDENLDGRQEHPHQQHRPDQPGQRDVVTPQQHDHAKNTDDYPEPRAWAATSLPLDGVDPSCRPGIRRGGGAARRHL
jgi:hypothetical protein